MVAFASHARRLASFVLALCTAASLCVGAPATATEVTEFSATATVSSSSRVVVEETWTYDFGVARPHYVERVLSRVRTSNGIRIQVPVRILEVADASGQAVPYYEEARRLETLLHIGSLDSRWQGVHTFFVRYELGNVIQTHSDSQEVVFDVTGSGWHVPVGQVEARVVVPDGAASLRPHCLLERGVGGVSGCESGVDGQTAWARTSRELQPGESLKFTVDVPSGTFGRLPLWWRSTQTRLSTVDPWFLIPSFLALFLIGLALRRSRAPIEPREQAPIHMGPAEMGAAFGARVDPVDLAATAVDLGRRGYLAIRRVPTNSLFALSSSDWQIERREGGDRLRAYEAVAMEALLGGEDAALLSDRRQRIAQRVPAFRAEVYNELSHHGRAFRSDPERLTLRLRVFGMFVGAFGALGWALGYGNFGFSLVLTGVLLAIAARAIPVRTVEGDRARTEIEDFRRYLTTTTAEELDELGQLDVNTFVSMLPYAIVLSAADHWAENFPAAWTYERPDWIAGEDPLGELGEFMRVLKSMAGGPQMQGDKFRGPFIGGEQSW